MNKKILYWILICIIVALAAWIGYSHRGPVVPSGMTYFGNEVKADINNDSLVDKIFLVTEKAASGTQFYVMADINRANTGYVKSLPTFVGTDIAPQTTEARVGSTGPMVIVNYGKDGVGTSLYLKFDPKTNQFGEVVQNFEGEADPARMTLSMKPWKWVDARNVADKFVLTLGADGRFSAKTDCNAASGKYEFSKADGTIFFGQMMSTLMFCEGSHEAEFTGMLSDVEKYTFTSRGQLILTLKDGKTMMFN